MPTDEDRILAGWRDVNDEVRRTKTSADEAVEARSAYASAALATGLVTQARLGTEIGVSRERVKAMAMPRAKRSAIRRRARIGSATA